MKQFYDIKTYKQYDMAGSQSHDFCGTFDGKQHTLTFNYGTGRRSTAATRTTRLRRRAPTPTPPRWAPTR